MLRKKVWIPILSVLIVAMGCGLYYGQKTANQEPIKVYKTTPMERHPVRETPIEVAAAGGHFHADSTWHADVHETEQESVSVSGSGETWRDGVWYPENPQLIYPKPKHTH